MEWVRTPEERFRDLPDFPFEPRYVSVGELRMAYIDEGRREGPPVLLLHGEPTWSYLYRHMIPVLAAGGCRVLAPDLIGFGHSDKPVRLADYSYAGHVAWMEAFLEALDLRELVLVCQDWGSLIGLRLAVECESRFAGAVIANGGLPTGHENLPGIFTLWRLFARFSPWFPIGRIVDSGCLRSLSPEERAAYDAPFPSSRYKAGPRAFPRIVPIAPDSPGAAENRQAWQAWARWDKPLLTAFSDKDPIFRGGAAPFLKNVPGARGMPHRTLRRGGHFLQEDCGIPLAEAVLDVVDRL